MIIINQILNSNDLEIDGKTIIKIDSATVSDGYHTFAELYDHRCALFAALLQCVGGWKSRLHADGSMFDGYFIVGTELNGQQITYHYALSEWDLFDVPALDRAPEWDGHSPSDVLARIRNYARQ